MTHNEYKNLKIGDFVQLKKNTKNPGRICQVIWKDNEGYTCVVPADVTDSFILPTDRFGSTKMLILHLHCMDIHEEA